MSVPQAMNDERTIRVRRIMNAARLNVIGHRSRADRAADVLAAARRTVARLDPKRQLQREAAAMRQQRVKRILDAARSTVRRLSNVQTYSRTSKNVVQTSSEQSPSPTPRRRKEVLPPLSDDIDDLRHRLANLHEVCPEVVADQFQHELDLVRREIDVTRREFDVARRAGTMSA